MGCHGLRSKIFFNGFGNILERLGHIDPGVLEGGLCRLLLLADISRVGKHSYINSCIIPDFVPNIVEAVPVLIFLCSGNDCGNLLCIGIDLGKFFFSLLGADNKLLEFGRYLLGCLLDLRQRLPQDHFALDSPGIFIQLAQKTGDPCFHLPLVLEYFRLLGRVSAFPAVYSGNAEPIPGRGLWKGFSEFFRHIGLEQITPSLILRHLPEHVFHRLIIDRNRIALVSELPALFGLQHRVAFNPAI